MGRGGGEGGVCGGDLVEGLSDPDMGALFRRAGAADYVAIARGGKPLARNPGPADLARLNHRLAEVAAIDHFSAPERRTIEPVVARVEAHVRAAEPREIRKGHACRRFGGAPRPTSRPRRVGVACRHTS